MIVWLNAQCQFSTTRTNTDARSLAIYITNYWIKYEVFNFTPLTHTDALYIFPDTLLIVMLGSAKQKIETAVFDAIVVGR